MTINMTWINTDLFELIDTIESGSRPKGGVSVDTGEVTSLGGENILQAGGITLENVKKVPQAFYERMSKGWLRDCDVLINKDGANTGKVGFFRWDSDVPACINEHVFLLRGKTDRLTQEYLYYTLLSDHGQTIIRNRISGSAQPGLKTGFIKDFPVALPKTTDEQTNIAAILATIDKAIEQTEAIITKQTRIKTGLMQDLLTRGIDEHGNIRSEATHKFKDSPLGRIPTEWDVTSAQELCVTIIDCKNRTPPSSPAGYPVIRTPNVRHGKFIYEELLYTDQHSYEVWTARGKPEPGDVVITREAPFGEACVIPDGMRPCLGQRVMIYKVDPKKLDNQYLVAAVYSGRVQKRLLELAGGSTVGHVRVGDIRNLQIPHPADVREQKRIATLANAITRMIDTYHGELAKLRRLRAAIMQDLLTGKVRVTELLKKNKEIAVGTA